MPEFRIKATETVTHEFTVEADTIEEAIEAVESGDGDFVGVEVDSSGFTAVAHTVPGVMGWTHIERAE